jgi:Fe2+ or Zn2+ uptake regulation protein
MVLETAGKILKACDRLDEEKENSFTTKEIFRTIVKENTHEGVSIDSDKQADIIDKMEQRTDVTKSTAYRTLNQFEEQGLLIKEEEGNPKKYKRP